MRFEKKNSIDSTSEIKELLKSSRLSWSSKNENLFKA